MESFWAAKRPQRNLSATGSAFSPLAEFSDVMEFVWRFSATTSPRSRGRVLLGMEPDMRTCIITMPPVAVFIVGTALCCVCCFKYGLQQWYERTLVKTRTKTGSGITYAASLEYETEQLEHALRRVTKLRRIEPTRSDLKYEAIALKEGIGMLHEHLRNSERDTDYCEGMKRPGLDTLISKRITMDAQGSSFVNPIFSPQQAISSGYMINPVRESGGEVGSPTSSDEECHNPKHKELEFYLTSTGGAILPSMLKYPGSSTASPKRGFPGVSAPGSRMTSPLGRQEVDSEGRSPSVSRVQQGKPREGPHNGQAFGYRMQDPTQVNTQYGQSPPGMPPIGSNLVLCSHHLERPRIGVPSSIKTSVGVQDWRCRRNRFDSSQPRRRGRSSSAPSTSGGPDFGPGRIHVLERACGEHIKEST